MAFLYLLKLFDDSDRNKIALICSMKQSNLRIGISTKILNKKNIPVKIITEIIEIEIDMFVYWDIDKNIKNNSLFEVHCLRRECFLTIDNSIWYIGKVDFSKIDIYRKVFFLDSKN